MRSFFTGSGAAATQPRLQHSSSELAKVRLALLREGPLSLSATPESDPFLKTMLGGYPIARGLGRLSRPEDVSGVVAFPASDRAAYITGQSLGVSGSYAMI